MKKNLWIWAMAALAMTACTSEDVPTAQVTENDWISPDGHVLIQLSAEGLPKPTASVSRAPITGTKIKELNDLGIFALSKTGDYTDNSNVETPTVLLNNVWGKGSESLTIDNTIHVDNKGEALNRISLYAEKDAANSSIYYYPISTKHEYNFYGYFPYQDSETTNNVSITADDVKITFDLSNGDIDMITGKANEADPIADSKLFVEESNNTPVVGTSGNTWNGYNARYIRKIKYSNELVGKYETEATANGITTHTYVPNIKFEHRTTQLRFFVVANDKQAEEDKIATQELLVDEIELLDIQTSATWSLKDNTVTWSGNDKDIPMQQWNADKTTIWDNGKIIPAAEITNADSQEQQAGYLMVKPQNAYKLHLKVHAPVPNDGTSAIPQQRETEITVQLKDQSDFLEGKYYNVFIQLNALQEVLVTAELADWTKGDDVFVPVGEEE